MKISTWPLLLIVLLLLSSTVRAQVSCPPGMMPYGTAQDVSVCGPIPGYNQDQSPNRPQATPMRWASKWGAIATDTPAGILGASTNESSQEMAEQKALAECQAKGGSECKLQLSYANGCGVMVLGNKGFNTQTAPTLESAQRKGMDMCNAESDGCHVYYSGCSLPQRIQ